MARANGTSNGTSAANGSEVTEAERTFYNHYLGESYLSGKRTNYQQVREIFERIRQEIDAAEDSGEGSPDTDQKPVDEQKLDNEESPDTDEGFVLMDLADTAKIIKVKQRTFSESDEAWLQFEVDVSVDDEDLLKLMRRAATNHYQALGDEHDDADIFIRCGAMFKKEYKCEVLSNAGGAMCWNYPENILVPTAEFVQNLNSSNEKDLVEGSEVPGFVENFKTYHEMAKSTAIARCRSRFPVPVILYNGKFICRSGTVAVRKGAAYEAARKAFEPEGQAVGDQLFLIKYIAGKGREYLSKTYDALRILFMGVDDMKSADVEILKMLRIKYICDLMVENRKIHTGLSVGSSEKINMIKYGEFAGIRIPYPGCEFFKEYSKIRSSQNYKKEQLNLIFDWNASEVDSSFSVTEEEMPLSELEWGSYTTWDLVTLTKNYLSLLLHYLENGDGGLLVHCISGWDRTPLFISLLRITLWADNLIHKTLSVKQMAYFTLGYDWYLFGHHLPNRIKKNEEIMHFCFKFLPEISSNEFSLNKQIEPVANAVVKERKNAIEELSALLLKLYEDNVIIESLNASCEN